MRKRLISTVVLSIVLFMLLPTGVSAKIFYFNSKNFTPNHEVSKDNTSKKEDKSPSINSNKNTNYLQFNNIFYFSQKKPSTAPPENNSNDLNKEENNLANKDDIKESEETSKTEETNESASQGTGNTLNNDELKMLEYINNERAKAGVSPLKMDTELAKVAQVKSQDMVDKNYFSHTSPTYGSPFDMMKSFGIKYKAAGENIARNSTMLKAHHSLMNSEGHRKNILNPSFTHVGIGIINNKSTAGITITQMFIKK